MAKNTKVENETLLWIRITIPLILAVQLTIVGLLTSIQMNTTNQINQMQKTLTSIEGQTNQLTDVNNTLARVEERIKDIEGMKSGVDKLLGKFGIAEITPTNGGTIMVGNIVVNVPPNSVSEPTWVTVEKIPSSSLPKVLPSQYYVYSDSFKWSTEGNLNNDATVEWNLAVGSECEQTKILYWNSNTAMWQEIPPEYCSNTASLVGFGAKTGVYVLAKERNK